MEEWSVRATVYVDPYGHARLSIEEGWLSFMFTPPVLDTNLMSVLISLKMTFSLICSYLTTFGAAICICLFS